MSNSDGAGEPRPPFLGLDWNDNEALDKAPDVKALLYISQLEVEEWLYANAADHLITTATIPELHRAMFHRVWPEFAGKMRGPSPSFIHRNVSIGDLAPGVHADDVQYQHERLVRRIAEALQSLDNRAGSISAEDFAASVRNIAALLHCDLIRIHPFVNGNGRIARLMVNYVGQRYGMRFIDWDKEPRSEYYGAVRTFVQQERSHQHFADYLESIWIEAEPD